MRRFLDIEIRHPAATSDYLAFATSDICQKLQTKGFLKKGLSIYGDNAYMKTFFMTVPHKGATSGPKDAFNFYHSQLRIHIECAFGMLVHRWGVLRKAIPMNISIEKTSQLVRCLCILHNFCIDEKELTVPKPTAADVASIVLDGGFANTELDGSDQTFAPSKNKRQRLNSRLDGGHHFDDCNPTIRKECDDKDQDEIDPTEFLMRLLKDQGKLRRPQPRGTTSTNN